MLKIINYIYDILIEIGILKWVTNTPHDWHVRHREFHLKRREDIEVEARKEDTTREVFKLMRNPDKDPYKPRPLLVNKETWENSWKYEDV